LSDTVQLLRLLIAVLVIGGFFTFDLSGIEAAERGRASGRSEERKGETKGEERKGEEFEQRQRELGVDGKSRKPEGPVDQRLRERKAETDGETKRSNEASGERVPPKVVELANRDIADGNCFDRSKMEQSKSRLSDRTALEALQAWEAGGHDGQGAKARELSPHLAGMNAGEIRAFMTAEGERKAAEFTTRENVAGFGGKVQDMIVLDYSDGTVIRYKPEGDTYRPGPTYSVEVKIDRNIRDKDAGPQGIAFKVTPSSLAVPKGREDIRKMPELTSNDTGEYRKHILESGHLTPKD